MSNESDRPDEDLENCSPDESLISVMHDIPALKNLLEKGVKVEHPAQSTFPVLEVVANAGTPEAAELLLSVGQGARYLNIPNDGVGFAPLHCAALENNLEVIKLFLKYGAAIDLRHRFHQTTPLQAATPNGRLQTLQLLVKSGADPWLPGWMNLSAVDRTESRLARYNDEESAAILRLFTARR